MKTAIRAMMAFLFAGLYFLSTNAIGSEFRKFGDVEKQYLGNYTFAEDTAAVAIKLFDISEMKLELNQGVNLYIDRHYQIKIMKAAGKSYADDAISYWHEDKISKFKAQTILPNGKEVKLEKKMIFDEEKKGNFKVKKFTMPSVEVGSIIEVEYRMYSKYFINLEPWVFQSELPTIESTVSLKLAPGFAFKANVANDPEYRVTGTVDSYMDMKERRELKKFVWTAKNLPAVREEPYISTLDNYKARLEFQFTNYRDTYTKVDFIKDLPTLCNELLDGDYGDFLKPSGDVKKLVAELTAGAVSEEDKARVLYDFVRDEIDDDKSTSYWVKRDQDEILKKKTASDSERNMLLVSMLKAAGIETKPALISTHSNGRVNSSLPFLKQYNRTCVYANLGGQHFMLDAGDRYTPFGLIPPYSLVDIGLLIEKDNPQFLRTSTDLIRSKEKFVTESHLDYTGALSGYTTVASNGYASRNRNWQIENKDDVKDFFTKNIANDMSKFEVTKYDSTLKAQALLDFSTQFDFTLEDHAETIDDEIYFTPFLYKAEDRNVFVSEKREFPVEYGYCWQNTELHSISLPEGSVVSEIPKDQTIDNDYFTYSKSIISIPGKLICSRTFEIKKPEVPSSAYQLLKQDYARMVDSDQAQIILNVEHAKGSN